MHTERFVRVGDLNFYVQSWGDAGRPPLFLVHGLASTSHMFDLIAEPLAAHYSVYAYDQRGHGQSDKPSDGYEFEPIARDLDLLADALGYVDQPLTVIGHSWGAYTALYYAATRPDRTAKAVLLDGGIRPLRDLFPTWAEGEIGLAPPPYVDMTVDDIKQFIRKWQAAGYRPETEPLALTVFDLSDPHNVHAHLSRANNMLIARALWEFEPTNYYARTRCPLLIVNAVDPGKSISLEMRTYALQAETLAPSARVHWMIDTIHDIPWHRPHALTAVLADFLD